LISAVRLPRKALDCRLPGMANRGTPPRLSVLSNYRGVIARKVCGGKLPAKIDRTILAADGPDQRRAISFRHRRHAPWIPGQTNALPQNRERAIDSGKLPAYCGRGFSLSPAVLPSLAPIA
jgi:hypothetical protein